MTDTNPNHVTCPQKRRTGGRRKNLSKWRSHKKWKDLVEEHAHTPDAVCVYCLKKHNELRKNKFVYLTINHKSRRLYESEELHSTWNPELMEVCCTVCNRQIEKGRIPCPVCHNVYISIFDADEMCRKCFYDAHPKLKEIHEHRMQLIKISQKEAKEAAKKKQKERLKPLIEAKKKKDAEFRKKAKNGKLG
jgi:hypothetical protein